MGSANATTGAMARTVATTRRRGRRIIRWLADSIRRDILLARQRVIDLEKREGMRRWVRYRRNAQPDPQPPDEISQLPGHLNAAFDAWLLRNEVPDPDSPHDKFDYRGAFLAGVNRGPDGGWPEAFKQHGHPLFSIESRYSKGPKDGGRWLGRFFVLGPGQNEIAASAWWPHVLKPFTKKDALELSMEGFGGRN